MYLVLTDDDDQSYCGIFETDTLAFNYCTEGRQGWEKFSVYTVKLNTGEQEHLYDVKDGILRPSGSLTTTDQYSVALKKMLLSSPSMTIAEIAKRTCRSEKWVERHLNLEKVDAD